MMGAFDFEGSQRANTMIAENPVVMIMTLKRPTRSAMIPGKIRPKILCNDICNSDTTEEGILTTLHSKWREGMQKGW